MKTRIRRREAYTLIDLLVLLAIFAVLLGILLGVILHARQAALQTVSMKNMAHMVLGVHQYADAHQGQLPIRYHQIQRIEQRGDELVTVVVGRLPPPSVHMSILCYVENGQAYFDAYLASLGTQPSMGPFGGYLSPADPTSQSAFTGRHLVSSYAANAIVFDFGSSFPATFKDGTSTTIVFAEHYALNCGGKAFDYQFNEQSLVAVSRPFHENLHAASFADDMDVRPVTQGQPPVSNPSKRGLTFQVAPALKDCDWRVAQGPLGNGMLAALADGSVRVLAPNISSATYWGATTPNKGEILGADWPE